MLEPKRPQEKRMRAKEDVALQLLVYLELIIYNLDFGVHSSGPHI